MAKTKQRQQAPPTPTLAPPAGNGQQVTAEPPGARLNTVATAPVSETTEVEILQVTAIIPVWPVSNGNPGRVHTDCRLRPTEALKLKKIMMALRARHATLKSGRLVDSQADTVQWMLEQLNIPTPEHELNPPKPAAWKRPPSSEASG